MQTPFVSAHDYNKWFFIIDYIGITGQLFNKNVGVCSDFKRLNNTCNQE